MLPLSGSISFLFYSARFDAFKLIHLCLDGIHCSLLDKSTDTKPSLLRLSLSWFSLRTLARRSTGLPRLNAAMLDITPLFTWRGSLHSDAYNLNRLSLKFRQQYHLLISLLKLKFNALDHASGFLRTVNFLAYIVVKVTN